MSVISRVSNKSTGEKLAPIGAGIARSLSLGLNLEDIAVQYGMPFEQVEKVARGNLVKARVRELTKAMDEQHIADAASNPVLLFAKQKGLKAIQRAAIEVDNDDEDGDGTASTRLQAAKLVLEVGGNMVKKEETMAGAVIMISADKVNLGRTIINNHVEAQPDYVDG